MLIKLLLLAGVFATLVFFVRRQHSVRVQANKRIAFFAFILLNAYAIVRPDDLTWLANRLGVGRGADLVLYMLVVAFVFLAINVYLKIRQTERRLTDLARALSIREAELVNRERGVLD
jgi:small membrane protein